MDCRKNKQKGTNNVTNYFNHYVHTHTHAHTQKKPREIIKAEKEIKLVRRTLKLDKINSFSLNPIKINCALIKF